MKDISEKIAGVKANVERLLRLYQGARSETKLLKAQVDTLRAQVLEKNKTIEDLTTEMDVLKTAQAIRQVESSEDGLTEEQKEVRAKMNEYIREIDACIRKLEA